MHGDESLQSLTEPGDVRNKAEAPGRPVQAGELRQRVAHDLLREGEMRVHELPARAATMSSITMIEAIPSTAA